MISLGEQAGHIQSGKASLVAAFIMIAFLFLGEKILTLIGIDVNSFAVAGSFVIFFLAFPIVAGAGTMTTLLSLRAEYDLINIIFAIMINILIVYIILKSSSRLERILGKKGINIIRKIFGIILLAIAVKLFAINASKIVV